MRTREDLIMQMINATGRVNVNTLAQHFEVSVETVRRDLTALAKKAWYIAYMVGRLVKKRKILAVLFK